MNLFFSGPPSCSWHFNLISNGLSKVLPFSPIWVGQRDGITFSHRNLYLRNPKFVCISFPGDESMPHCTPKNKLGKHPYLINKSNNRRANEPIKMAHWRINIIAVSISSANHFLSKGCVTLWPRHLH